MIPISAMCYVIFDFLFFLHSRKHSKFVLQIESKRARDKLDFA